MRTLVELQERMQHYHGADYIYVENMGYIAWHVSTGDNLETIFLEAPNFGAHLYGRMVSLMLRSGYRPYHSVFCYCLESNEHARDFYRKFGFTEVVLGQSIYKHDGCVLFWIVWEELVERLRQYKLIDEERS